MSSTFRASPWVSYNAGPDTGQVNQLQSLPPNPSGTTMIMDMDIDMDAPQISTLREEDSPPPPAKKQAPGRKPKAPKLKVTEPASRRGEKRPAAGSEEDFEEQQEDEEDQLIDDDDEAGGVTGTAPASTRSTETTPKKKPGPKKKPKKDSGDKKSKDKGSSSIVLSGAPNLAPTMSMFLASPSKAHTSAGPSDTPHITVAGGSVPSDPIILKLSAPAKKKQTSPRKSAAAPRGRGKATKQRSAIPPALAEDAAMSEAGFTGTAASSPATAPPLDLPDAHDAPGTPETEIHVAPSSPATVAGPLPAEEPPNLEGVPIPQYPLPTRPFPVQPPVKITSGFAPPIPLDRSGKKVRHWKIANREIRGIAGGRWFAKAWVGDKDSEFAASVASGSGKIDEKSFGIGHHVGLSRLAISAPVGRGRGRGSKSVSAVGSTVPSRAGSVIPDVGHGAIRAPTKMREVVNDSNLAGGNLQPPPSETGDSDMAPPEPSES